MTGKEIFLKYWKQRLGGEGCDYKPGYLFDEDFLDLLYKDAEKDGIKPEDWGPLNMTTMAVNTKEYTCLGKPECHYYVYKLLE